MENCREKFEHWWGSDRNIVGGCNLHRVIWERLTEVIFESRHKELSGSGELQAEGPVSASIPGMFENNKESTMAGAQVGDGGQKYMKG